MTVDLEAIAKRGHCDVSALRNALPLLEQGYLPPFLARYRRDELGGVDETSLWALSSALRAQKQLQDQRQDLSKLWEGTVLADPAIGNAIRNSNSKRLLDRLSRRLKTERADVDGSDHLAVRILNPQKGDSGDPVEVCEKLEAVTDAQAAVAGLEKALAQRLAGDPRVINAAVRWLSKNAKIHVASISDPHTPGSEEAEAKESEATKPDSTPSEATEPAVSEPEVTSPPSEGQGVAASTDGVNQQATEVAEQSSEAETAVGESETVASESEATTLPDESVQQTDESAAQEASVSAEPTDAEGSSESSTTSKPSAADDNTQAKDAAESKPKAKEKASKKQKKISPRQRRRRWLVSVLKQLEGKRLIASKLSSFQVVMLGRALRSQVAQCLFEYDATKLVGEIQKTIGNFNRKYEDKLKELVLEHEANIREAAEAAWWDELHERASAKLLTITADQLRRHMNRGCVEANVVMSIDAVGPRTAATAIVASDGRVIHCEDLPCQLSGSLRTQAVNKMGELIHQHHVDLIVISNGPARRACMIAMNDLISQSPEKSVRWTLADRSGADAYASSSMANQEMRSTPRRFRASAWLAFSVLQPAQAYAKVDPLKLRLASFQRELSDDALASTLSSVMVSGASRGGVDVNSASVGWLSRLPGMNADISAELDKSRRENLWDSRAGIMDSDVWNSSVESRQAIPFLRVFGSEEVLDGTLIHPDDYDLAKKLAKNLEIELPPSTPPGYEPPDFETESPVEQAGLVEQADEPMAVEIEDVTAAVEGQAQEDFAANVVAEATAENESESSADSSETTTESESLEASSEEASTQQTEAGDTGSGTSESETNDSNTATSEATDTPEKADDSASSAEASADAGEASADAGEASADAGEGSDASDSAAVSSEPDAPAPEALKPIRRPRPEKAKVEKCIKEWQVGRRRVNQLVNWLCDPFGDSDESDRPPAVMNAMPSLKSLKQGDEVIGVVIGVVGFGVFVELAPDCSGLVHVSKICDHYVEDLHEAVQVGDVITAWVTGIDEKKRRVALSAVSPEREAELQQQRQSQHQGRGRDGGRGRGGAGQRGGNRGGAGRSGGDGKPRQDRGSGGGRSRGGDKPRGDRRGGGRRGDKRGGDRSRGKKPESYRVVAKAESAPISEAMQKGEEPLRSFGDLMQFYKKEEPTENQTPAQSDAAAVDSTASETAETVSNQPATQTPTTESAPETNEPAAETVTETTPPAAETSEAASTGDTETPADDASGQTEPTKSSDASA